MAEKNPRGFMDVTINEVPVGRMTFELFIKAAPKAAENFRALCTGGKGIGNTSRLPLHYKGSFFYDFWKGYSYVKGGDLFSRLGLCGESIYNGKIPDEKSTLKCDERGLLAMNIFDWYGLGSHCAITLEPDDEIDRFHTVFGKLVSGWETLDKIANALVGSFIQVSDCGECNEEEGKSSGRPHRKKAKKARM